VNSPSDASPRPARLVGLGRWYPMASKLSGADNGIAAHDANPGTLKARVREHRSRGAGVAQATAERCEAVNTMLRPTVLRARGGVRLRAGTGDCLVAGLSAAAC